MEKKFRPDKAALKRLISNSSKEDKQVVEALLNAIKKFRTEIKQLTEKLYLDPLTKAYSRHYYNDVVMPGSEKHEYYIMLADVNNLKLTNDGYGHKAGDKLILDVVKQLSIFGQVIRLGGDEFLVVGNKSLKDLKTKFANFSYGVVKKEKGENINDVLSKVDDLLYKDKKNKTNTFNDDKTPEM